MNDLTTIVAKNDLNLSDEMLEKLTKLVRNRTLSYLSPEKETGPFLLYCTGTDFEGIANRCSYPLEVILLTALYYRWNEKMSGLGLTSIDNAPKEIQKDLANSLLIATYLSVQKQLGDVIAGRSDADKCLLIPKNVYSLEKLMDMVSNINGLKPQAESGGKTIIQANNVQMNNVLGDSGDIKERIAKNKEMLKLLIEGEPKTIIRKKKKETEEEEKDG